MEDYLTNYLDEVADYIKELRESKGISLEEMEKKSLSCYKYECQDVKMSKNGIEYVSRIEEDDKKREKIVNDLSVLYEKYITEKAKDDSQIESVKNISNQKTISNQKPIWRKSGNDWKH